jgi:hypothetical protein
LHASSSRRGPASSNVITHAAEVQDDSSNEEEILDGAWNLALSVKFVDRVQVDEYWVILALLIVCWRE